MSGPPPKPLERKRALGNPGKRKLPNRGKVLHLASTSREAPPELGPDGRKAWDWVTSTAGSWLADSDRLTLTLLAEAYDRRAYILRVLADEGWSVITEKGYPYKHPLVPALLDLEKQMTSWLSLLGLTPSDRSRLGVAEVKAASTLEKLRAQAEKR